MALNDDLNIFKKIAPKDKLSESDKKAVMDTIATAKLFLDTLDLISVKQAKTKIELLKNISSSDDTNQDSPEKNK